ncbi:hypothetical protein LZ012_17020 [Dechloromonas sp. XY25]|uniref:Phasin domain-containing protein n=1 Tax=Dechloromonas hankyongensis TaxID=2908002 RepID=A0ABS9K6A6_9RHOO|nr:hypothetical protein [Dechloromonas hankyongensis]MCG2578703.1 hypothetical protein [Dechloromonas hankyongensis]
MPSRQESAAAGGGNRTPDALVKAAQNGVTLSGHLFDLEAQFTKVVLRETLQRQREFATLANAFLRVYAWPFMLPVHTREVQDIGRRSVELALSAQTAFVQSLVGSLAPRGEPAAERTSGKPVSGRRTTAERRVSAQVINFPERRVVND